VWYRKVGTDYLGEEVLILKRSLWNLCRSTQLVHQLRGFEVASAGVLVGVKSSFTSFSFTERQRSCVPLPGSEGWARPMTFHLSALFMIGSAF
jgi:hypothetical protein